MAAKSNKWTCSLLTSLKSSNYILMSRFSQNPTVLFLYHSVQLTLYARFNTTSINDAKPKSDNVDGKMRLPRLRFDDGREVKAASRYR